MINNVNSLSKNDKIYSIKGKEKVDKTEKTSEDKTVEKRVSYAGENNQNSLKTYSKPKYNVDMETVNKMKAEIGDKNNQLKEIVSKLINNQKSADDNLRYLLSGGTVFADSKTIQDAKDAISEDGEFGVKKTAQRILDFAKAISGGDPDKIEELRKAVNKGFKAIGDMCKDGKLPSICQDTYDDVMKGFDEWAKEGQRES